MSPRISTVTGPEKPQIGIFSFGPKSSTKPKAQFEIDCSKLRDPQGQKQFVGLYGWDPQVVEWVKADPRIPGIIDNYRLLAEDLLTWRLKESSNNQSGPISSWLSISFKDTSGKWAAAAVAELVADALIADGWGVMVGHAERKGAALNDGKAL